MSSMAGINGRMLTVNEARPREERPRGGGDFGGGRGGHDFAAAAVVAVVIDPFCN
jgi:hypothetical protein